MKKENKNKKALREVINEVVRLLVFANVNNN